MRIAVPGSVIGALLAQWLATGQGLGYFMLESTFESVEFSAAVAALTFTPLALSAFVGILETSDRPLRA